MSPVLRDRKAVDGDDDDGGDGDADDGCVDGFAC